MWHNYELDNHIIKTLEPINLCKCEKASVDVEKGALAMAIRSNGSTRGFVFMGGGKLLLDAIVETEEGAFGKSIKREITEPFLVMGDMEKHAAHFNPAGNEDLRKIGLNGKELFEKGRHLLDTFSRRRSSLGSDFGEREGRLFAFRDGEHDLDILVVNGSHLLYSARDISFISNGQQAVLNSLDKVIVSACGRHFVVGNSHGPHRCC